MARVAVLDACVLYPAALRDILLRCAEAGLFAPRWSEQILDETIHALARTRPEIPIGRLDRLRYFMVQAFPEAMTDLPPIVPVGLPDEGDEHVLATAVAADARFIVTSNTRHFPGHVLGKALSLKVVSPDEFLGLLNADEPEAVTGVIEVAARALRNPPVSVTCLLDQLERQAPEFTRSVREQVLQRTRP